MPFTKFVEIGRIAFIAFGRDEGKICAIVDVVDQNRALVDGPLSGVTRQSVSFKRMHLTKFRIDIQHSCGTRVVKKAWLKDNISEKWAETNWAKRLQAKKTRLQLTDFDRFKLMKAKQARNRTIRREFSRLKTKAKKLVEKPKPKVAKPTKAPKAKPAAAPKAPKEKKAAAKPETKKAAAKPEVKKAEPKKAKK